MIGKTHSLDGKTIFACCDRELLGKKIKFNSIDISINSKFYGEEEISTKQLIDNFNMADSINIFGVKSISILLKENLISKEAIIYLENIPHIQIYRV